MFCFHFVDTLHLKLTIMLQSVSVSTIVYEHNNSDHKKTAKLIEVSRNNNYWSNLI
jgi:hypothetical protein